MKQFFILFIRSQIEIFIYLSDTIFLLLLKFIVRPLPSNEVLIIKPDGIGDFILFRNFIGTISEFYLKNKLGVSLVVDIATKSLVNEYKPDSNVTIVFIDKTKFRRNVFYRYKFLFVLRSKVYNEVIYFSFSRVFRIGDTIARFAHSKEKTAVRGDEINRYSFHFITQFLSGFIYSKWVEGNFRINRFEYLMIQELTESIVGQLPEIMPSLPGLKWNPIDVNEIAIFPFASDLRRCWPLERYAELINLITSYSENLIINLLGPPDQKHSAEKIMTFIEDKDRVKNKIGSYTLPALIEEINKTQFLISNETMSIHIAAATGTPALCITFGNLFGRFYPYPKSFKTRISYVYPLELQKQLDNGSDDVFRLNYFSINTISVENVFKKFTYHFNENLPETVIK